MHVRVIGDAVVPNVQYLVQVTDHRVHLDPDIHISHRGSKCHRRKKEMI